ncbi:MAG: 4Fe-4S binding protein [Treponema sp.]|nr:4Fe-4S binding protein [Treponema sp.]
MFAEIFMCALMTLTVFFFTGLMNGFSAASVITAAFFLFIFYSMSYAEHKKKGSGVLYRRIFQITFALFFCIAFIGQLLDARGSMAITESAMANGEIPFCHITIPQILIPFVITKSLIFPSRITGHYAAAASMIAIWLCVTLTIGRGWCSHVCFYGGWEEGFSRIGKKKRLNLLSKNKEIRNFQMGFFGFIVLASLAEMAAIYCQWFCPFKLVTEFHPVTDIPSLIAAVIFIGIFLGFIIVLPVLTKRRTQCSAICPFGAFASLTDRLSMFSIKIDTDKCKGCLKCASVCPFGAIDITTISEKKGRPEFTCAKCGECIKVCEENAISYRFKFEKNSCRPCAKTKIGKAVQEIMEPGKVFRFAAYSFAFIMGSSFFIDAINRIISLLIK